MGYAKYYSFYKVSLLSHSNLLIIFKSQSSQSLNQMSFYHQTFKKFQRAQKREQLYEQLATIKQAVCRFVNSGRDSERKRGRTEEKCLFNSVRLANLLFYLLFFSLARNISRWVYAVTIKRLINCWHRPDDSLRVKLFNRIIVLQKRDKHQEETSIL